MTEERKYADGRIQAQISMKAHRFLRDHSYPGEPLYVTLDRILGMYKVSDVAPIVEENRKLRIALEADVKTMDEYKRKWESAEDIIKKLKSVVETKTLVDFTQ